MLRDSISDILKHPSLEIRHVPEPVIANLEKYLENLVQWTAKINLTSEKQPEEILRHHIFDSLQFLRWITPSSRVLDIGSGAGLPGIPLKILLPDLELVLLESQKRRVGFLLNVKNQLKLENAKVLEGRAEEFHLDALYLDNFDFVLLRAVGSSEYCAHLSLPFLKDGGHMLLIKDMKESEKLAENLPNNFRLDRVLPIESYYGKKSQLISLIKCST